MNCVEWPPRAGTWYLRWDKSDLFQVTGYDAKSDKARIETYDGTSGANDPVSEDVSGPRSGADQ